MLPSLQNTAMGLASGPGPWLSTGGRVRSSAAPRPGPGVAGVVGAPHIPGAQLGEQFIERSG